MKATLLFVVSCVALALSSPVVKRQAPFAYVLPDGVELIIGSIKTTFSCANRIYGYYGDVDNNCKIFHVCNPVVDEAGQLIDTQHFSFACGNLTTFDQENLVCVHDADGALNCGNSPSLYDQVNSRFGITERPGGR